MKSFILLTVLAMMAFGGPARAQTTAPEIGQPAPAFSAIDTDGKSFKLSDYKGQIVVLEWTNHLCPFTRKHYESGNMQKLQKEVTQAGAIWISIVSSAPGKEGNIDAATANTLKAQQHAAFTHKVLDPEGAIGRMYQAQTTPHMFVINKDGILVYMGAMDDNPSPSPDVIPSSKNYVKAALEDLAAGRPVAIATTQAYGCSVKY